MMNNSSQTRTGIPHSRPTVGHEEIGAIAKVIESAHIAQGREVRKFEREFARKFGIKNAAAVNSGTSALHLALLAMGVGENDEVIIPSYVCTALLNAVRYVGARPVLADVDPGTYNLDPKDVRARLTGRTKALIVPHLFGLSADMEGLQSMGIPIIEDCAQAVGGRYHDKPVGTFGRMAVFSFYATKVMTTGEGGMVISDSKKLIEQVKDLREYDKNKTYQVRYNYKMTDIQAAMGRVQLSRLDEFIRRRRKIATFYQKVLEAFDVKTPPDEPGHIYYRYVIEIKIDPNSLIRKLRQKGIECARPVYMPLHCILNLKNYSIAESAWRRSVSLPIYPALSDRESERVIAALKDLYPEACCGG